MLKILLTIFFLLATNIFADTQTKFVGTATSGGRGGGSPTPWTNPGNVTADDAVPCNLNGKVKNGGHSELLTCTMSGNVFTIPSGATINGITVNMEARDLETGPAGDSTIFIIKGGTAQGTDQKVATDDWPIAEAIKTWGGTSNLWGLSWTVSDINATNFGVEISMVEIDNAFSKPYIDYVQISIDYTPSGGAGSRIILIQGDD